MIKFSVSEKKPVLDAKTWESCLMTISLDSPSNALLNGGAYLMRCGYCMYCSCFSLILYVFGSLDQYVKPYSHRLSVTHQTWFDMWPMGLITYHIFPRPGVEKIGDITAQAAHLDENRKPPLGTEFVFKADSSLRFYLFRSSLPLRSCSRCASITQRLIFLSINQRKAPCVRHALWVSAWPERIHIYSWEPHVKLFDFGASCIPAWFSESRGYNRRTLSASFMHTYTVRRVNSPRYNLKY